jgi:hypothetical protein
VHPLAIVKALRKSLPFVKSTLRTSDFDEA